eukprot:10474285-Alexandrium_andersonii.AAC.1
MTRGAGQRSCEHGSSDIFAVGSSLRRRRPSGARRCQGSEQPVGWARCPRFCGPMRGMLVASPKVPAESTGNLRWDRSLP